MSTESPVFSCDRWWITRDLFFPPYALCPLFLWEPRWAVVRYRQVRGDSVNMWIDVSTGEAALTHSWGCLTMTACVFPASVSHSAFPSLVSFILHLSDPDLFQMFCFLNVFLSFFSSFIGSLSVGTFPMLCHSTILFCSVVLFIKFIKWGYI